MRARVEVGDTAEGAVPRVPIAELAARLSVTFRTLRFYEDKQLLTSTILCNRRGYDVDECQRAADIVRFRALGFSIADIRLLLPAHATTAACHIQRDAIERQIAELEHRRAMLERALEELRGLASASA
jgi:DNA-binding transcriptional MerR regulator